jgi:hypothetical protein
MNVTSLQRRRRADALYDFVECAARLLASDDEALRCRLEGRLLQAWPQLQASGVFEIFQIRDPALRSVLAGTDAGGTPASAAAAHRSGAGGQVAYMSY